MDIKQKLAHYSITPNKALGQNFLVDEYAVNAIIDASETDGKNVLEIGAGLGALTAEIKKRAAHISVVEIDAAMVDVLRDEFGSNSDTFDIIHSDFLKVKYDSITRTLGESFSVVANLPYYVTTPIVMRLLRCPYDIHSMTLMMQREAAEHFTAKPNTKLYSPAAILTDYLYNTEKILELSPASYYPQPDVYSVVLKFSDKGRDRSITGDLYTVLNAAFSMRRKTLVNNLAALFPSKSDAKSMLVSCGIAENARAEQLTTDEFLTITAAFRDKRQK